MFYILQIYGSQILYILRSVDLIFLPLVLVVSIFQYLLSAWRWCFIASKTQSSINYSDAIKYYYIAGFMNNILPTGILGDIYRTLNIKINNDSLKIIDFEKKMVETDLIYDFFIKKFDKDFTYYQIIFNGTPNIFLKIMSDNNLELNTTNNVWLLK